MKSNMFASPVEYTEACNNYERQHDGNVRSLYNVVDIVKGYGSRAQIVKTDCTVHGWKTLKTAVKHFAETLIAAGYNNGWCMVDFQTVAQSAAENNGFYDDGTVYFSVEWIDDNTCYIVFNFAAQDTAEAAQDTIKNTFSVFSATSGKYKIVYIKRFPLFTCTDNLQHAVNLAKQLRNVGYSVSVWKYTNQGCTKMDI